MFTDVDEFFYFRLSYIHFAPKKKLHEKANFNIRNNCKKNKVGTVHDFTTLLIKQIACMCTVCTIF